jgi:SAM-dependent methyltransferase
MFPRHSDHVNSALAVPARLQSLLREVEESLAQITTHAARATAAEILIIIAEHRGAFYQVMDALGGGIIDFLAEGPTSNQVESVRAQIVAPIRSWSASSPIFNRMARPSIRGSLDFEVPELIIQNRQAGADFPSVVMNDFYLHSIASQAIRNRFTLLTQNLLHEIHRLTEAGVDPVRMLTLTCTSRTVTVNVEEEPALTAIQLTCLSEDAAALRNIRTRLAKSMTIPPRFLRISALKYARSPMRLAQAHDICYSAMLLDTLTDSQAVTLMSDCHDLLAPGGVLILGCPTRSIPINERVLIAWILGLTIHYREESDLRKLFSQTPFGADAARIEREPLGLDLAIIATRS